MLPRSGAVRPATSRSSVVLPAPLSPTSTSVPPAGASSFASRANSPSRFWTSSSSMRGTPERPGGSGAQRQQPTEGDEQEQHRQHERRIEIGLQRDVDRERHGLRGAGQVAGKRDRRAELMAAPERSSGRASGNNTRRKRAASEAPSVAAVSSSPRSTPLKPARAAAT